jgi:p-methyltransferase
MAWGADHARRIKMNQLDVLFLGAVMNYDGTSGSLANYIQIDGKWKAPFQYIYEKRRDMFKSEADACIYGVPNLSICKLVDYLKRRMELKYHIIWHFDYHKDKVHDILQNNPPRLIAISSTLAFYPEFLKSCVAWLNQHKAPETKIVVGGKWLYGNFNTLGADRRFEALLSETDADYYVINLYGEETLYRLLLAEKANDLAAAQRLPNIAYRRSAVVSHDDVDPVDFVYEGQNYRINQVTNETHTPGETLIDFANIDPQYIGDVVHIRTAVSCPFRCRFCTFPALEGRHVMFDIEAVMEQLKQLKRMGVKYLFIIDDTFNAPPNHFESLLDRMIQEKLDMRWVSFFRSQFANAEIVQKMYAAGCRMVFCGFESGNDELLNRMNKKVTVRQYKQGIDYLDRAGISVVASYIVGYPGETYETAMDTLRLINDPRITFSRGSVFYYDPKAPVGMLAKDYGLTGFGAQWRHNTMNSREAARIHLEIIGKLQGVNVPHSDGGAWNIFYLYCRGMQLDDIKTLYREFNQIQRHQIEVAGRNAFEQYRVFGGQTKARRKSHPAAAPGFKKMAKKQILK